MRSLPESERSVWGEGFWDEFLYGFNHSETECGLSRSELAWGVGLGRNQEIAVRLKTLHSSVQDAKKMRSLRYSLTLWFREGRLGFCRGAQS